MVDIEIGLARQIWSPKTKTYSYYHCVRSILSHILFYVLLLCRVYYVQCFYVPTVLQRFRGYCRPLSGQSRLIQLFSVFCARRRMSNGYFWSNGFIFLRICRISIFEHEIEFFPFLSIRKSSLFTIEHCTVLVIESTHTTYRHIPVRTLYIPIFCYVAIFGHLCLFCRYIADCYAPTLKSLQKGSITYIIICHHRNHGYCRRKASVS